MRTSFCRFFTLFVNLSFCIVSLTAFTGCHSLQHTEISANAPFEHQEMSLMRDIEDGCLEMPFGQACLIASGVTTDKKIKYYLTKIDFLISQMSQETHIGKTTDPLAKAKIIFDWLQKNVNEGIYNDCYDIKDTLNLKVGNCLSYAIRFTIICRHFDVDIKNVFIPGHIYSMFVSHEQKYYFEHTHSDGIVKKTDLYHPRKKVMRDEELIAEIFLYKARNTNTEMKYEESIKYCLQALVCSPRDNRPVILLMDNYIAQKNYEEAFRYLDKHLSHHPDDEISLRKTHNLLKKLYGISGIINENIQ